MAQGTVRQAATHFDQGLGTYQDITVRVRGSQLAELGIVAGDSVELRRIVPEDGRESLAGLVRLLGLGYERQARLQERLIDELIKINRR